MGPLSHLPGRGGSCGHGGVGGKSKEDSEQEGTLGAGAACQPHGGHHLGRTQMPQGGQPRRGPQDPQGKCCHTRFTVEDTRL